MPTIVEHQRTRNAVNKCRTAFCTTAYFCKIW